MGFPTYDAHAAFQNVFARSVDANGAEGTLALDSSVQQIVTAENAILAELQTPVAALPHQPLDATSDLTYTTVQQVNSGNIVIVAGVASQTVRLHRFSIQASAACTVELYDDDPATGTSKRKYVIPSAGILVMDFSSRPYVVTTTAKGLWLKVTGTVTVNVNTDTIQSA